MDPYVNELINQHMDVSQFRPRQSSGLVTPLIDPSSSLSLGSSEDLASMSRLSYTEKIRRFKRYMNTNSIESVSSAEGEASDPDKFYNSDSGSSTIIVRYVQRPCEFSTIDDISVSDSAINCYDTYDIHKEQELIHIDNQIHQPGLRYDDSLIIEKWEKLLTIEDTEFMKYKMNLTECFDRYIFTCSYDTILVLKDEKFYSKFSTRTGFTTEHINTSVLPFAPYSINFIKVSTFKEANVLIVCYDDGRAVLYDLDKFIDDEKLHMIIQIELTSSVWGADSLGDFIAFSDNSHSLSLFYVENDYIYYSNPVQLIHNIPALEIVSVLENSIYISCVCISGELVTVRFDVECQIGALDKPLGKPMTINLLEDRTQIRYNISHQVVNRLMLQENGWTIHHVHENNFKEVYNPYYLGVDSEVDIIKVLKNSRVLDLVPSHLCTSELGGAASFENLHIHTRFDANIRASNRLNTFTDKFNRIKKAYFETKYEGNDYYALKDKHLIVTTVSKAGIYRASNLICNSDTGDMFEFQLPGNLDYSNRLSITRFIPELCTVIVASQAGFFTIFRLVKHRGLHSIREEYVAPFNFDPKDMIDDDTITGIGVKRLYSDIFWIYVSYRSGNIQKFEIRERSDDSLDSFLV